MPMYEYRCGKCGACFEELVRGVEDEAELVCPVCGAGGPQRQLSACCVRMAAGSGEPAPAPSAPAMGGCGGGGGFS